MKKKTVFLKIILCTAMLIFARNVPFAQTSMDTVKTGKSNDPMVMNPGETSDSMAVKPGKTNDDMAALTDTGFISKNIMDNMLEIKLSKLGQNKAIHPQVKRMAALMIKDHTIMLNDLKRLAVKKGVSPGNYMHELPLPDDLTAANNFDNAWVSEMLELHEAKITELQNVVQQSSDPDIKAAAGKALPKIKMHRYMLMKLPGSKVKSRVA